MKFLLRSVRNKIFLSTPSLTFTAVKPCGLLSNPRKTTFECERVNLHQIEMRARPHVFMRVWSWPNKVSHFCLTYGQLPAEFQLRTHRNHIFLVMQQFLFSQLNFSVLSTTSLLEYCSSTLQRNRTAALMCFWESITTLCYFHSLCVTQNFREYLLVLVHSSLQMCNSRPGKILSVFSSVLMFWKLNIARRDSQLKQGTNIICPNFASPSRTTFSMLKKWKRENNTSLDLLYFWILML